jgi:hypothetical protein
LTFTILGMGSAADCEAECVSGASPPAGPADVGGRDRIPAVCVVRDADPQRPVTGCDCECCSPVDRRTHLAFQVLTEAPIRNPFAVTLDGGEQCVVARGEVIVRASPRETGPGSAVNAPRTCLQFPRPVAVRQLCNVRAGRSSGARMRGRTTLIGTRDSCSITITLPTTSSLSCSTAGSLLPTRSRAGDCR